MNGFINPHPKRVRFILLGFLMAMLLLTLFSKYALPIAEREEEPTSFNDTFSSVTTNHFLQRIGSERVMNILHHIHRSSYMNFLLPSLRIYGSAVSKFGNEVTGAEVNVVSSIGALTTWVYSNGYWSVDCGNAEPSWPMGTNFSVYITACCAHKGWFGTSSGTVLDHDTDVGLVILEPNPIPSKPETPIGPLHLSVDTEGVFSTVAFDPNPFDRLQYRFDWDAEGKHDYSQYTTYVSPGNRINVTHQWDKPGLYVIQAQVIDNYGGISNWSDGLGIIVYENNHPPTIPLISGNLSGFINQVSIFTFSSFDQDYNALLYYIDWGDHTNSGWVGPFNTSDSLILGHAYSSPGQFSITAKAKDIFDFESAFSDPFLFHVQAPMISFDIATKGLFSVTIKISNIGEVDAHNIRWSLSCPTGFFLTGSHSSGNISSISSGQEIIIKSEPIIGIAVSVPIILQLEIDSKETIVVEKTFTLILFIFSIT